MIKRYLLKAFTAFKGGPFFEKLYRFYRCYIVGLFK